MNLVILMDIKQSVKKEEDLGSGAEITLISYLNLKQNVRQGINNLENIKVVTKVTNKMLLKDH